MSEDPMETVKISKESYAWLQLEANSIGTAAELAELKAALTQSRAETAAAYERAAQEAHKNIPAPAGGPFSHTNTARVTAIDIENEIRALATPDQSAALDAVRAEARAQGMREAANRMKAAIEASGKLGRIIGFLGEDEGLIAAFREACGAELIERFHAAIEGAKA